MRILQSEIEKRLFNGKAILLFGPRQSGKSTLVEAILEGKDVLYMNGDDAITREVLTNTNAINLKSIIGSHKIFFVDEAQRVADIGLTLKLITDQIKQVQVIATGSSAFELSGKVNEPLTGRKYEFLLYPLSFDEMRRHHGLHNELSMLGHRMVYGYYPGIVTSQGDERRLLKELANSYLYKDLLTLEQMKKPVVLEKLVKALALQVGSEVSYTELAQTVGASKNTVERYIDLLEKAFIVFVVPAYSRNVRNEIKKGKKVYFYDCGIRNAIIDVFAPVGSRTDTGALWENYLMAERRKMLHYAGRYVKQYFWRTAQQQEIDLVEEEGMQLRAYEFKWSATARVRFPQTFTENYDVAETGVISRENAEEFLMMAVHSE